MMKFITVIANVTVMKIDSTAIALGVNIAIAALPTVLRILAANRHREEFGLVHLLLFGIVPTDFHVEP